MEKDVVTVDRKEYEEMQKELSLLYALEAAGVDIYGLTNYVVKRHWDGKVMKLEGHGITFD